MTIPVNVISEPVSRRDVIRALSLVLRNGQSEDIDLPPGALVYSLQVTPFNRFNPGAEVTLRLQDTAIRIPSEARYHANFPGLIWPNRASVEVADCDASVVITYGFCLQY